MLAEEDDVKVIQTLGKKGGKQLGFFQYKRTSKGVLIDLSIGLATASGKQYLFTPGEWQQILDGVAAGNRQTFGLSKGIPAAQPSLHKQLAAWLPAPTHGHGWNVPIKAAIVAVLENEGTLSLYHGGNAGIQIVLQR